MTLSNKFIIMEQEQEMSIHSANQIIEQSQLQKTQSSRPSYDNIGLDVVNYDRTFSRNRGTLSQNVKSLEDMYDRLAEPFNDYQKGLYPHIQQECKLLVAEYNKLVDQIDPKHYSVHGYYLNGPHNNGKRKATTTRYEKKSYGVSEYKETLKSIDDRLRHIKIDCLRKVRCDGEDFNALEGMIDFCDAYHEKIGTFLQRWDVFITNYRQNSGINVVNRNQFHNPQSRAQPQVRIESRPKQTVRTENTAPQIQTRPASDNSRITVRSNVRSTEPRAQENNELFDNRKQSYNRPHFFEGRQKSSPVSK